MSRNLIGIVSASLLIAASALAGNTNKSSLHLDETVTVAGTAVAFATARWATAHGILLPIAIGAAHQGQERFALRGGVGPTERSGGQECSSSAICCAADFLTPPSTIRCPHAARMSCPRLLRTDTVR